MALCDMDADKRICYQDLRCPPEWIERIPGYDINSCKFRKFPGRDGYVVVATYVSVEHYHAFAKIFALEDLVHPPFSSMNLIWQQLHMWSEEQKTRYVISSDGWVVSKDGMHFPTNYEIDVAVYDTMELYRSWRQFPQAPTFDILKKLLVAKSAVERMQMEELNGTIRKNIEDLRECMRQDREEISRCEERLTTIYENAAAGMNLLEEYGVKIDLSKPEPILKERMTTK